MVKSKKTMELKKRMKRITAFFITIMLLLTSVQLEAIAIDTFDSAVKSGKIGNVNDITDQKGMEGAFHAMREVLSNLPSNIKNTIAMNKEKDRKPKNQKDNGEILEIDKNTTTYLLEDGKKKLDFHFGDARFKDKSGKLTDYDPTLKKVDSGKKKNKYKGYAYENKEGDRKNYIPTILSKETPIVLENDEHRIEMHPVLEAYKNCENAFEEISGLMPAEEIEETVTDLYGEEHDAITSVLYKDKNKFMDLEYISNTYGIKENIILNERPETNQFQYEFRFENIEPRLSSLTGVIDLFEKGADKIIGSISAPYMNDATEEAYSEDLSYQIEQKEGMEDTYIMTLTVSEQYLYDEERIFPIVIDPIISMVGSGNVYDVYVSSYHPNSNFYTSAADVMLIGVTYTANRTYLKIPSLKDKVNGKYIDGARLELYDEGKFAGGLVGAQRVTKDWTYSGLTWNSQPTFSTAILSSFTSTGKIASVGTLTLTDYVRGIANGANADYGIVLKSTNETSAGKNASFFGTRNTLASYRPKLSVTYYDNVAPRFNFASITPSTSTTAYSSVVPSISFSVNTEMLSGVQYSINEGAYKTFWASSQPTGSAQIPASEFSARGKYTIRVRAVDRAGNYSSAFTFNYFFDNVNQAEAIPLPLDSTLQLVNRLNTTVTWSTSNTNIATVSSTGIVTAKAKGTVTITATSTQDASKKALSLITVTGSEEKRFYGISGGYAPTGNFSQTFTDITIPSVLGDISLSRTYNSFEVANDSVVGKGFHFNYNMRVIDNAPSTYVIMPDSAWWRFTKNSNGTYTASDCRGTLTKNSSNYILETLNQMRYGFNLNGYLVYVEDFKGNKITFTRNSSNQITEISSEPSGLSVSFSYSGNLLTRITDNVSGRIVQYSYSNNFLTSVTDAGGFKTTYEYASGLLIRITERTQDRVSMTYDTATATAGLIKTITDDQGVVSTYDYSTKASRQIKIVDNNSDTYVNYNTAFAITKTTTYPKAGSTFSALTENTMNSFHEVTSTTDHLGNTTNYTYDPKGNLTRIAYPDGSSEQYTYDASNNKTSDTDKSGLTTTYTYDAYTNLTKITRPLNGVNHVINQYEYYTDNTYPIRSLLKKEIGPLGDANNCIEYTYSFTPNAVSPNPVKTVTTTKRVGGVTKSTQTGYDKAGRVIRETTPTGIITVNTYDQTTGLLTSTEIWDNSQRHQTTSYQYNPQGDLETETDTFYDNSPSGITTYDYNKQNGNLIKVTAPDKTFTEYDYNAPDSVDTEVENSNKGTTLVTTTTTSDELGREVSEIITTKNAAETTTTTYTYDTARKVNITTVKDELGGITATETGWDGRVLKQTNPNGLVQTNTYDASGRLQREEYRNGSNSLFKWTEYAYDAWGRVTKRTDSFDSSGSSETLYTYDRAGNVLTELVKVEAGKYSKTVNDFDAWGQNIQTTLYEGFFNASGAALDNRPVSYTQTLYDWDGQVLLECKGLASILSNATLQSIWNSTSVSGYSVTKHKYDNFRRTIQKIDALEQKDTYQYDHAGRIKTTTDRKGTVHTITYDNAGRKKTENSGNGTIVKSYNYGSDGNLESVTEGTVTTEYEYDGAGNVIKETCGIVEKRYSETILPSGKETLETIIVGNVQRQHVKNVYNSSGQLTAVHENGSLKASYAYDVLDRLTKTTYANGTTEENTYNLAGLPTSVINKKGTSVISQYTYVYYYNGNQRTKSDSTGFTNYTYDGRGQLDKAVLPRVISNNTTLATAAPIMLLSPMEVRIDTANQVKYYSFTPTVTGTYTIASTGRSSDSDPYCFLYNASGTQLALNDDGNGDLNFKITYTLTAGTRYIIGAKMYSTKVGSYTLTVTPPASADNTSLANAANLALGSATKVNINTAGQMRYYKFTPDVTGTYIFTSANNTGDPYGYLYNANGTQLTFNDDGNGNFNFKIEYTLTAGTTYIIGAKLYSSTATGGYSLTVTPPSSSSGAITQTYTYERNGNRMSMTEDGVTTAYTYDKNDRLLTEKTGTQTTITYTYDKNGNLLSKTDGTTQTFDQLNRMTSYKKGGTTTTTTYTYYPDDMRKSKKVGTAAAIDHVWVGDEIALDINGTSVVSSYVHGLKLVQSSYGWYLYNAHGDVTALADGSGNITYSYDYDPFGKQRTAVTATDANPYRFCGEYFDVESGYTYLRARYYDPAIGRFISEDPIFDGYNWYIYCENDPINMIDPSGLKPGDLFTTIDLAARDAAIYMGVFRSFDKGWEYGTAIYKTSTTVTKYVTKSKTTWSFKFNPSTKKIAWSPVRVNYNVAVKTSVTRYSYVEPITIKDPWGVNIPSAPKGKTRVAAVHTHPMGSGVGITRFSDTDINYANNKGIPIYVHGPNGQLRKYDPAIRIDNILYYDLPKSKKTPWLNNNIF